MSQRLPEFVDPIRLASQNREFSGTLPLEDLPRLVEALKGHEGDVRFQIEFYRDEKRRSRIRGRVRADLVLQCQRCLEAMTLPVDADLDLAVISVPEEAERLPEECEPVWLEEETLRLMDLVEDELILAIPQIPRHEEDDCSIGWENPDLPEESASEQDDESEASNPFSILEGLKTDDK